MYDGTFLLNYFRQKVARHRFSIGFQMRLCNGRRYLKVAFMKIPKMSMEKNHLGVQF